MTDYYDLILVAVPVIMIAVTVVVAIVGYSASVGASLGALLAAGVIGHAMFVRAPVPTGYNATPAGSPRPEDAGTG